MTAPVAITICNANLIRLFFAFCSSLISFLFNISQVIPYFSPYHFFSYFIASSHISSPYLLQTPFCLSVLHGKSGCFRHVRCHRHLYHVLVAPDASFFSFQTKGWMYFVSQKVCRTDCIWSDGSSRIQDYILPFEWILCRTKNWKNTGKVRRTTCSAWKSTPHDTGWFSVATNNLRTTTRFAHSYASKRWEPAFNGDMFTCFCSRMARTTWKWWCSWYSSR